VWNQPYLETCCRAALHRLRLAGGTGRPTDVPDIACLKRLSMMGLCTCRPDGLFEVTPDGIARHDREIRGFAAGPAIQR
jgi:hypothetical protein